MILADQIKDLEQRSGALERCLNIEQKRIDLLNEEEKTQVPDFWDNPDQAREQLRRVAAIKAWVDDYDAVAKDVEDLALMPEFVKEGVVSEQEMDAHYAQTLERIEKLEMRNMLRRDEDKLGAILDINAGAGGTEALDWASMLMRMYTRWGEAHGYKVKVLDFQAGDEVGVKSCTLEFEGEYAYGYLKSENGRRSTPTTSVRPRLRRCSYRRPSTTRSRSRSMPPTSSGTRSVRRAPEGRTSTRWRRPCACATTRKTPTRARRSST